jgi:two-component sensor histidine kinase
MILFEWFTNSCKYGAHSRPAGRLLIEWDVEGEGAGRRVRLRWQESGVPAMNRPATPGLGSRLVRQFAATELRGRSEMRFPPTGADHLLEFPLP